MKVLGSGRAAKVRCLPTPVTAAIQGWDPQAGGLKACVARVASAAPEVVLGILYRCCNEQHRGLHGHCDGANGIGVQTTGAGRMPTSDGWATRLAREGCCSCQLACRWRETASHEQACRCRSFRKTGGRLFPYRHRSQILAKLVV